MAIVHLAARAHGQCCFLGEYDVFEGVTGDCPMPLPPLHSIPWDEAASGLSAASAPWNISSNTGNFYVREVNKHQLTPRAILVSGPVAASSC